MRKCPNCKKPVPVGARRCVYCRAMLNEGPGEPETQESSTRLGYGASGRNSDSFNGTTSFGRPSSIPDDEPKNPMSRRAYDGTPHQTMLGLGPISNSSSNTEPVPTGLNQRTIAGMPGISFDPTQVKRSNSQQMPAARSGSYQEQPGSYSHQSYEYNDPLHPIGQSRPSNAGRSSQQGRPVSQSMREAPMQGIGGRSQQMRSVVQSSQSGRPVPKSEPARKAEAPAEDPLAGMAGVAPMPSSLVDEEFVDLTSKLFGDDFAAISNGSEEDEDYDGLDFDTPAIPVANTKAVTVQAATTTPQPKTTPSAQPAAKPAAKPAARKPKKKASIADFIIMGASVISALLSLLLISSGGMLIVAAIVNILVTVLYFVLRKKLGSTHTALMFFAGALLLFVAMLLNDTSSLTKLVFVVILFQLISAITSFLKKA